MNEVERERIYWRILVVFVALSPLVLWGFYQHGIQLRWNQPVFIGALVASIPATLLIDMFFTIVSGKGTGFRFWIKNPSQHSENSLKDSIDACRQKVVQRLESIRFTSQELDGGIQFKKAKDPKVHSFLHHAFSGNVVLKQTPFGVDIVVDLTLNDILLLQTDEPQKLQTVCDFLTLHSPDCVIRSVPLYLICGVNLSLAASVLGLQNYFRPPVSSLWITPVSAGAAGMLIVSGFYFIQNRGTVCGARLLLAGLYLSSLPYLAALIRIVT